MPNRKHLNPGEACPECGRYLNRASTVDIIATNNKGKVAMIVRKNDPDKGFWALPGGYVDFDESLQQATQRELTEETGFNATKLKFVAVYSEPDRDSKQNITHVFYCRVNGKAKAGDDALNVAFFSSNQLPENIAADHRRIIQDYFKNNHNATGNF